MYQNEEEVRQSIALFGVVDLNDIEDGVNLEEFYPVGARGFIGFTSEHELINWDETKEWRPAIEVAFNSETEVLFWRMFNSPNFSKMLDNALDHGVIELKNVMGIVEYSSHIDPDKFAKFAEEYLATRQ